MSGARFHASFPDPINLTELVQRVADLERIVAELTKGEPNPDVDDATLQAHARIRERVERNAG
jgi:hypothetical protein